MIQPGGLQRLYDWPEEPANLCVDAPEAWRLHASFSYAAGVLRLDANLPTATVPSAIQAGYLEPGWYVLRARASATGNTHGSARVSLKVGGDFAGATDEISGTSAGLQTIERKFVLVSEASVSQIRVEAYQKADGLFTFEKIELRRLREPAVECFVRFPNYRGLLWDDGPQRIKVWCNVRPGVSGAQLRVLDGGQAVVHFRPLDVGEDVVEIDASAWPEGRYALTVLCAPDVVGEAGFAYPDFVIVKASASQRAGAYIDADGYLVTSEGRQFVLGAYDTGGFSADENYYQSAMDHLELSGGKVWLNYMLQSISGPAFRALISAHSKRKMLHIQPWNRVFSYNSNFLKLAVNGKLATAFESEEAFWTAKAKDLDAGARPGFVGFYIADELPADKSDDIFRLYRTMAEAEPHGVCFGANNSTIGAVKFRDCVDVLDVHTYPVYNTPEGVVAPMAQSYWAVRSAVEAMQGSRPCWAVLQDCILTKAGHFPTIDELRWMAWSAIVAGARGIMWWSIGTQGGGIGGAPLAIRAALLARLTLVNAEIVALEPALLSPDVPAESTNDAVKVTARVVDGVAHLWAVNITPDEVHATVGTGGRSVNITLPAFGTWLQAEPVDPVWIAANAAATRLEDAALIDPDDFDETALAIADTFKGFAQTP
jgi:hypothetical protein